MAQQQGAPAARRPNIVLILADDLGIGDVSAFKAGHIPTPNIDSLGRDGVRFVDAHVSASVCSPSRSGLMTGRQGTRHGSEFNRGRGLNANEQTLGELLKSAGYATGAIGKWHLGMKEGRSPLEQGFDEFFGAPGGSLHFNAKHPDAVNGIRALNESDPVTGNRLRPIFRGTTPVEESAYLPEAFSREAVDFIDRHAAAPFFLYVAYNTPHAPVQTTRKYYDRFPQTKDHNERVYRGMVSALDDGVGTILTKLKASGLERDTLVVFLSDNGAPNYLPTGPSNADYAGYKRYHTEGGHRTPLMVRWPSRLGGGATETRLTSSLDLFPTFAAAAGVKPAAAGPLDGVDLLPFLTGVRAGAPHDTLFWRAGANFAVRDGKWKLIVVNKAPAGSVSNEAVDDEGTGVKLGAPFPGVSPLGQHVVLYDLQDDVNETKNLAAAHPEVVAGLRLKFSDWDKSNVPTNDPSAKAVPALVDEQAVQLQF